jgi:internalin A
MISLNQSKVIATALAISFCTAIALFDNPKPIQAQEYNSFAQWCANKNKLSPETRHTVEVLLWHSRTTVCEKAERILMKRINLQLGNSEIVDLRPLSSFSNLRTLDLAHNQVVDVSAIANLKGLNFLNLSNNRIVNVSPLANLTELGVLSLQGNQITSASSLRTLGKLEKLELSDNPLNSRECPIANQSACQF